MRPKEDTTDYRKNALVSRIKTIDGEINNLLDAIQEGVKASVVAGRISQLEKEKEPLEQQLEDI